MTEKILKWGKVVLICYCALFCLRFAQLNFGSGKMIAALYLPHELVFDNAELMMRREDCLKDTVAFIKLVDLNGDLKKEFIFDQSGFDFDHDTIYSIESNGTFRVIADFRTRDELPLYIPPLTIWGYPVILADDGIWGVTLWEYVNGRLYAKYIGWIDIYTGLEQDSGEYAPEDRTPFALGFNGSMKPEGDNIIKIEAENGHPEVIFDIRENYIICLPMVSGINADTVKYCAQIFAREWGGADIPLGNIFPGNWKIENNMPENEGKAMDEIIESFIAHNPEVAKKIGINYDDFQEQKQEEMDSFKKDVIDKLVDGNGCVTIRIGENGEDLKMQVRDPDKND